MLRGEELARHVLAETEHPTVKHACPDCMTFAPNVFCGVCHGTGLVTTDELYRAERIHNARQHEGGSE